MRGGLSIAVVGLALCATPALIAQRGIEFHGTPASVTAPGVDGRFRGTPASVTDPTFVFRNSAASTRRHREHSRDVRPVYVEPYYGYYVPADDSPQYAAQQTQQQDSPTDAKEPEPKEEATSTQDEDSRYGQHYFDGREKRKAAQDDQLEATTPAAPPAKIVDDSPLTTLVYRDGHKSEVRNYAIVGSNLIDLTKTPVLKKIPLDSLDLAATRKENEDNGVDFHTP